MSFVLMLIGLLATGVGAILIGFGIPINEFSLGNTLILAGTIVLVSGLMIFAISRVVAALSRINDQLARGQMGAIAAPAAKAAPPPPRGRADPRVQADPFEIPPEVEPARPTHAAGPRVPQPPVVETPEEPAAPRAAARPEPAAPKLGWRPPRPGAAPAKPAIPDPRRSASADNPFEGMFEEAAAPAPERAAPPARREPTLGPTPAPERAETVSVLKSGVVDGMAYTLYTDGSIEAELPQGVVRFGSIEELRNHLEKSAP
jgi:hypothetical protein